MKTKIEDKIGVLDSKPSGDLNLIGILLQKTAAYRGQWGISIFLLQTRCDFNEFSLNYI